MRSVGAAKHLNARPWQARGAEARPQRDPSQNAKTEAAHAGLSCPRQAYREDPGGPPDTSEGVPGLGKAPPLAAEGQVGQELQSEPEEARGRGQGEPAGQTG